MKKSVLIGIVAGAMVLIGVVVGVVFDIPANNGNTTTTISTTTTTTRPTTTTTTTRPTTTTTRPTTTTTTTRPTTTTTRPTTTTTTTTRPTTTTTTTRPTTTTTITTQNNQNNNPVPDNLASYYYGTWDIDSVTIEGVTLTIEQIEAMGDYSMSDFRIVFINDGTAYVHLQGEGILGVWTLTDTGIQIGQLECYPTNEKLCLVMDGGLVYFDKTSDSQEMVAPDSSNKDDTNSNDNALLLEYTFNDDWTYTVSGVGDFEGEILEIPSTYNGLPVTSIGEAAFNACTTLTSVIIPNSVTYVAGWAFYNCTSLTSVTIGNSVTKIGYCTFSGCTSLTNITIPDSVTSISYGTFSGCTSLSSVTISNSMKDIYTSAFRDCTSLISIVIPDSVTMIWDNAFNGCTALTSITIPNSVTEIERDAFKGCTSLTSVNFEGTVSQWKTIYMGYGLTKSFTVYCTDGTIPK